MSIPEAKDKSATATVTDASGQVQGDKNFSITFDANGTYTHKLKGGQKLTITGLSSGWKYEVTEASLSGWTASSEGASGTIAAGEKSVAAFTNTYGATGKLSGGTSLSGEKTIKGRAWTAQDKFCFVLTGIDGAPMPEGVSDGKAILQMTQSEGTPDNAAVPFHFGNITYTKPGTYVYNIVEARAGDGYDVSILPGMSVSQALYRVTVTVTDEAHDGTLVVTSTMLRLKDDSGATLADGAGVKTDRAAFTNVFDVKEAEWDLRGTKNYEDKTGSHPLSSGMFQFELTAKTEGAPMPANTVGVKATANVDATGRFAFEQVTFDENDVNADKTPKSYEYELREVNSGVNGMTYDGTVWHITVTASLNEAGEVVFSVQNTREGQTAVPGETISFSNTYEATPATVQSFICGTKTLKGRDSLDGEKFTFSLTQTSGPEGGCAGFSPEVEVGDLADSEAKSFNFGTAMFTKAGTYVFEVREVAPDQPAGGMTYDGHVYTVTVKIADQGGQLYVQSTTYSDEAARDVNAATFINTYRPADADYAGITVSKTLIGRTMREGEFNFTIKGEDGQSDALLASSDRAFANDGQRATGEKNAMTKLSGLHFDRSDVGTYRFKVAEVIPADPDKLPGVTYDATEHEVVITVEDALDGTLRVTTTVDDAPGNEVAFQNTYQATPGSFDTANFGLAKVLEGRDWASTDAFTFKLVGLSGAPMPANSQVTVKAADASSGRTPFDFGQISYAAAGTYEYEVCEVNAGQTVNGVDYTTNVAHFRVTVTDSTATGQLVASSRLVSGSAAFVNRYSAELDYNAMGGLSVTKTLEGTSAAAGKFSFTVKPDGDDILGIAGTYASGKLTDGGTVTIAATSGEIVFTQNDAGKTWNYTVTEKDPDPGYSCDCSTWNVSVSVANDVEHGRLLVTTTVSGEGGTRSWTYASDGEAVADAARVEFVNRYAARGSTAEIVGTKTLNGRLMSAREFEFQLVDKAGVVVATAYNDESGSVNFGRLSYTTPGTYTYTISEVIPGSDAGADGISYSAARYKAEVVVEDNQAGALVVKSVKMTQERNDAGVDTKTEVADAIFTNRYDEHERDITIHAQKNLVDNAGTFPLARNAFTFTLEGVGGYADANAVFSLDTVDKNMAAPMPQGTEGNTATVGNNAVGGAVTWPAISYTAKPDAGRAYVYKFAENPGSVAGMTYDGSIYYAVVRNAKKGAGIQTSIEYYKIAEDGSVKQLDTNVTPSFNNIYSVDPTSVTLQGQKTVSGRDWNQGESYAFNLTAAADDANATGLSKTTAQAVKDGVVAVNANKTVASTPESGRVASFSFGAEAVPTVTFNRAGTFSFNITENAAQDGQAGMSMDKHTARATVVVTDLDESGNHTGMLRVSSVTYANTGASDADRIVTDKAAFTNAYHASGTFDGVTVSKTLEGRASTAGQFTFAVTGLWYNGVQTSVDGSEASLSNKAAGAGVSGTVVSASGAEKLFARKLTEQDLGRTFAYRIHENQPAAAGYTYDTGYTGDAVVLVKVLARKNDPAKLYTVTTVLKGAGVTELLGDGADASALTDEKIVELKQKPDTYVQQHDASEVGVTTPTVSFVNRYTASLDYGAAGGLQIEKTLTYPKDATIFGSPKSTFRYIVKPADEISASKVGISTDGKVFETANVEADAPKTVSLIPAGGLTFTQDDAGKTFTYTVSEIDDKATDYTYDKTVHTVKAVVADNGDGTLRVTTAVSKQVDGKDELEGQWIYPSGATSTGVATVKFKNTYTVTEAATYTPSVTKVVAGADAPGKFTFAMTAADDATKTAIDGKLITGSSMSVDNGYAEEKQTTAALKDGEHEKIDFSKLTFNKPGTYKFAINEQVPNDLGEWKYDTHTYVLTITVTDEGGKLVARGDGMTGSEGFIFTNSYQTSTSYELQGGLELVKTLSGHDLHAGMFGFTVTGEDPASTDKLNKLLRADEGKLTVRNDEPQTDGMSHTGILGGLTFATKDAGKTFTYKVVENGGGKPGYQYDSTYWTVEIAVKNRGNGSLYTETTVKHFDANNVEDTDDAKTYSSKDGSAKAQVFFTNSYVATGTFDGLAAEKVMDSGDKIESGQYTFDLYAERADGSLEKMDEGKTKTGENGTATVDFGKVHFKLGNATSGTQEQTIDLAGAVNDGIATKLHNADHTTTYSFNLVAKERLANLPEGVRPVDASATCRVLLEVTDNNNGKLASKVTYRDGTEKGKIVFHNTRDKVKTIGTVAKPDVDIDGQLLSVGDSYVYTINWVNTEADDNGNLVPAKVTVTDELPTGVVFEAFEGKNADKGTASGQSLTWNLGEQPAGSHGSVRVRVKITEDAVKDAQGAVGAINNAATVTIGNKSYTGTTTNYVPKKSESDAQDSTGSGVALGDELTYTIGYKNTEGASATVTITDAVPAGTEFVGFAGDHKDAGSKDNDGNLTWTLKDVPASKEGTVQFKVRVTEDAFKSGGASGDISNQASVAVGNNPAVKTNTTTDEVSDGCLTLSKTVTAAEGIVAPNKAFTFRVLLYQADGTTPLTGTFAYAGRPSGTNGTYVSGQIKSGDTIALKAGGSVTVTVPVGARYEVQELDSKGELMTSEDGFAVVDKANPQKGTVGQATQVGFTNVYSVESTKVESAFKVQKKISGRNWMTSDAFTMTLTAQGEAPMPKGAKDGVSTIELHKDAQVGNFGTIEYTKPGTYTYVIAEQPGDETSLTFSKATYRATVTVTDNGAGKLLAKTKIAQLTDDAGDAAERTVEAAIFTNTAKTGSLTVKKTVVGGDSQREFGFTVALADGDGEPVSGTFGKGEHAVTFTDGKATFTLKDGGEKTVAGLPVGAHYTVTEDAAEGYTTTVNGADGSKAEGAVTEDGATVAFTNTYGTATEGRDVSTAGLFTKTLEGRDWAEGDSFQFALTGEDGAPMPEGSADGSKTVSVTAAGTKAGDRVAFDFGAIRYTLNDIKDAGFAEVGGKRVRAKTFTYTVREVRPDDGSAIAGVAYDGHVAMMTVTVTDDGSGNLTATTPAIAEVSGGDFVNTYTTELDYSARAGVLLSKTLSGRAMEAGQFAFTVAADAETAAKLGLKTDKDAYAVAAADDGKADLVDLIGGAAESDVKFTDADAGKTYSFTVTETKLGGEGYTNDTAPCTVTIAPGYDAATGRLTVTTTVAKDGVEVAHSEVSTADDAAATPAPVTVTFQNSYEATGVLGGEGSVAINATKTLTGRAAAAGEFSFSVRDAQGDVVATATNRASGDGEAAGLSFSPIAYTTDALEQMVADGTATRAADGSWAIPYTVSEDGTDRLPAGVTATASSFGITVKATDNGKGGLDVAVDYPEGSDGTLSFVNGYSAGEATVDIAGTKTLALSQAGLGLAQADIAGKYTFKIEPLDGAPALVDASGKMVTEATNDAAGNVELGHVTFKQPSDLDDVEIDGDGLRTKTFAYRVSESGSVDGVVNDATAARTFAVKVVEDTNAGTLAAEVLPAEGTLEGKGAFEFTNTYGVNPTPSSVTDQITVNKKLKGRDLAEGEFEFQLVEIAADGSESVAATGKNAADGTVALSPVAYTAPGTHSYELREVAGTAGGVTYDRATYRVRTTVADAGNGKLTVRHELADAEGNPTGGDSVTFTNGYEAAPVTLKLGAAKVLKGAELKAGQFSFEIKSRDGKVMSIAKNAADGSVTFDALTFKQTGTYTFTVSEVDDGQAHVTYDKAVHKIVVTVSDKAADGTKTGYLSAKVSYEGDANMPPVFTNSYAENPGTPGTPENPGTPGGGSGGGSDSGSGGRSGDGSKGGMPDTGDRSLPVEALGAMAGIGALAVAGGAVLYRRRR